MSLSVFHAVNNLPRDSAGMSESSGAAEFRVRPNSDEEGVKR